jgi:hypothetical protein
LVGWDVLLQHARAGGGADSFGDEDILQRHRYAGERATLAGSQASVGGAGGGPRLIGTERQVGANFAIDGSDARQRLFGQLQGAAVAAPQHRSGLGKRR